MAAVGAVIGALAMSFSDAGTEAEKAEEKAKKFNDTLADTYSAINKINGLKISISPVAEAQSGINDLLRLLKAEEATLAGMTSIGGRSGRWEDPEIGPQRKKVAELRRRLEELQGTMFQPGHGGSFGQELAGDYLEADKALAAS